MKVIQSLNGEMDILALEKLLNNSSQAKKEFNLGNPVSRVKVKGSRTGVEVEDASGNDEMWTVGEAKDPIAEMIASRANDKRIEPNYDISTSSESSLCFASRARAAAFRQMKVEVFLPGERLQSIDVDVKDQALVVGSPKYLLAVYLPMEVLKDGVSKAQWFPEEHKLVILIDCKNKLL